MKFLLTGGAGFIGSHLVELLLARGDRVRIIDDLSTGGIENIQHLKKHKNFKYVLDTVMNRSVMAELVDEADIVLHLAAAAGVRSFVFLSSIKVNGEGTPLGQPFTETDPPNPQDAYALSKWEAEQALMKVSRETGLEIVILRPPLVYGPEVKANFLRLMQWVAWGVPLPLGARGTSAVCCIWAIWWI